jgi:hypothetical protein
MNNLLRFIPYLFCAVLGLCLALGSGQLHLGELGEWGQPASAQFLRPEVVAPQVYERLPDFPLENDYVNRETGEVAEDNTLASRLIRYHLYNRSRPPYYRLDWKLTLADYLGANLDLVPAQYPGHSSLQENPMKRDRAIINSLTREERNELVTVLASIFNPNAVRFDEQPPTPTPQPQPIPSPSPRVPISQPGSADLLKENN